MDALPRVRILIWIAVLSLWGVMVYQFLGEEQDNRPKMRYISNPYRPQPPPPSLAAAPGLRPAPSSLDYVKPPYPQARSSTEYRPEKKSPVSHENAREDAVSPSGFIRKETRHFDVYSEGYAASQEFLEVLESLHGNLMLDMAPFSPWADEEKVAILLFRNQETYRRVTGRPAWSGGASSVPKRKVYVYESEELLGILAHELCHIYYDSFFLSGASDPLWLSEGIATLAQVERGLAAPSWLRENMDILERGGGFTMAELMAVTTTARAKDDDVRLWYAQAYSTVRFLLRSRYKSNFYKFSEYLRQGKDTTEALYRSYGMPYNRVKALEFAWRFELTNNSLNRSAPADR
ncbi:MAG: hypothetical protein A3J74_08725 [Elusimicrobia bacterium RIFCSPHIGHO2_02_FULL_57_9]|nr:MAG: hypothetical protein A3J74_08725 [Elusimicrobia bacterium RIFCSPHIGHO2_02_FULL_57_9]